MTPNSEPHVPKARPKGWTSKRGGHKLEEPRVQKEPDLKRDFRITDKLLEKFGFTEECPGCEAKITGGDRRGHNATCRARIEKAIRDDDAEADVIQRRDARMTKEAAEDDVGGQRTPRGVPEEEAPDPVAAADPVMSEVF